MAKDKDGSTLDLRRYRQAYLDAAVAVLQSGLFAEFAGRSGTELLGKFRQLFGEMRQRRAEYHDAVAESHALGVPLTTIAAQADSSVREVEDVLGIPQCSFCDRPERQPAVVRSGDGAICRHCLHQAREVIYKNPRLPVVEDDHFGGVIVSDTGECSFCRKPVPREQPTAEVAAESICVRCVEFAEKICGPY